MICPCGCGGDVKPGNKVARRQCGFRVGNKHQLPRGTKTKKPVKAESWWLTASREGFTARADKESA